MVAEAIEALNRGEPAVVAVSNGRVVGTCVARFTGERAWVLRSAIDNEQRNRGVGSAFVAHIERLVLFIDEVDEITGRRSERRDTEGVTNELLKAIPSFRARGERLLVCATNSVRDLDPALVRPGRFDYVLPIGPPDAKACAALWQRFVSALTSEPVRVEELAAATQLLTPADIEFAARKAAQSAFERALAATKDSPATHEDFEAAVAATRPT